METAPDHASLRTTEGYLRLLLISNIFCYPHFPYLPPVIQNTVYTNLFPNILLNTLTLCGNTHRFCFVFTLREASCPCSLRRSVPYSIFIYTLFLYLPVYIFDLCGLFFCRYSLFLPVIGMNFVFAFFVRALYLLSHWTVPLFLL